MLVQLIAVFLSFAVATRSSSPPALRPLRFGADGHFRIVQMADFHFGEGEGEAWGPTQDKESLVVMESVIAAETAQGGRGPDLAVLSGDQLTGLNIKDNATAYWDKITGQLGKHGLPHTAILGNHDAEPWAASGGSNQSAPGARTNRTQLMMHDMRDPLSYSQLGPEGLRPAASVYVVDVYPPEGPEEASATAPSLPSPSRPALQLVHLDSGGGGMVEEVFPQQIAWFNATMAARRKAHGGSSSSSSSSSGLPPVPALVFVHIPLHEFSDAWAAGGEGGKGGSTCFGRESDGISPTVVNNGLFEALEAAPEVMAVFVGHDHCNDFCCSWGGSDSRSGTTTTTTTRSNTRSNNTRSDTTTTTTDTSFFSTRRHPIDLCFGRHSGGGGYGCSGRGADYPFGMRVIDIALGGAGGGGAGGGGAGGGGAGGGGGSQVGSVSTYVRLLNQSKIHEGPIAEAAFAAAAGGGGGGRM